MIDPGRSQTRLMSVMFEKTLMTLGLTSGRCQISGEHPVVW